MEHEDFHKTVKISKTIRDSILSRARNNSLPRSLSRFFSLLDKREIRHLLVGGMALLQYVKARSTEDIDLIISEYSLEKLSEVEIIERKDDLVFGRYCEFEVNFFLTRNPFFDKILEQCATDQRFAEKVISCATVKGLLLLKLYALPSCYREGNFIRAGIYENDIAMLIYYYKPQTSALFEELSPYMEDADVAGLREIVADIEKRIERFRICFQPAKDRSSGN
jgi:hypothetical protein